MSLHWPCTLEDLGWFRRLKFKPFRRSGKQAKYKYVPTGRRTKVRELKEGQQQDQRKAGRRLSFTSSLVLADDSARIKVHHLTRCIPAKNLLCESPNNFSGNMEEEDRGDEGDRENDNYEGITVNLA